MILVCVKYDVYFVVSIIFISQNKINRSNAAAISTPVSCPACMYVFGCNIQTLKQQRYFNDLLGLQKVDACQYSQLTAR